MGKKFKGVLIKEVLGNCGISDEEAGLIAKLMKENLYNYIRH